jgi:CHAT domain-containing protein/tetratricopeptide (TPR) repeat protein
MKSAGLFLISTLAVTLAASLAVRPQNEQLTARFFIQKSDAVIRQGIDSSSADELRSACDRLLAEEFSTDARIEPSERIRAITYALAIAEKIAYPAAQRKALLRVGALKYQYGPHDEAAIALERFLSLSTGEPAPPDNAQAAHTLALIYRNQARYDKALHYYNLAFDGFQHTSPGDAANVLNGTGAIYMYLGDYNQAETAHRRSLAIAEKQRQGAPIADALFHLGIINRLRGNYSDALNLYHQARQISETLASTDPSMFPSATILRHIAGAYFLQGNRRLALDYTGQALVLDERRNDAVGLAYSRQMLALIRTSEGNYTDALSLAERTLPQFEKLGDKDGLTRQLALLGNIHLLVGNNEKSLGYFRRTLGLREASNSRDGVAIARIGIAKNLLVQKKFADALDLAKLAAASVEENGNRELLWQAQSLIGQIYLAQDDCDSTRTALDAAIGTIESLRGEVVGGASENSLFFAERIKPYQLLSKMFAAQGDYRNSFEYAERAKARVLVDAVQSGKNQSTSIMTVAERFDDNRFRGNIASLHAQISKLAPGDKAKRSDLDAKLATARGDMTRFRTNLYAAHPQLRIKHGEAKPVELRDVDSLLNANSALLEYSVSPDAVFLYAFTRDADGKTDFRTYKIDSESGDLSKSVARFRQMLAERNVLFSAEARALYDRLLRPAAAQLAGKTNIVIVPDDDLWELPFQALQSGPDRYVLDDANVSYTPSLTILRELRSRAQPIAEKRIVAFGNPVDVNGLNKNFASLIEAEKQTYALQNLYGGKAAIFNRSAAGEAAFRREAEKGFSTLHIASHGILDNNSPLNSYVLLAPDQADGDDGRLEAWEILEMNLKSDLVMLSACETARGEARAGEGLVGLAWSLMIAGARNVAVSQWKVDAASTTRLTVDFYKSLNKPIATTKPAALREAALKLRRTPSTAHPFYWAGFVLIGAAE